PSGTSARLGRAWLALAASSEPVATPTAKAIRHRLMTSSLPLKPAFTSVGRSEIATAPTSQNQETIMAPTQSRRSARKVEISARVEVQGLRMISRFGTAGPVGLIISDE